MAITANTDFVSGAILTAQQQNNFPRGIMAKGTRTTSLGAVSALTVAIPYISFTAVANRNYRISWYEPSAAAAGGNLFNNMDIREGTTSAGTVITTGILGTYGGYGTSLIQLVTTFTAGVHNIVPTVYPPTGTINLGAAATYPAFIIVEDIGTA